MDTPECGYSLISTAFAQKTESLITAIIEGHIEQICKEKNYCVCSLIGYKSLFHMKNVKTVRKALKELEGMGQIVRLDKNKADKRRTYQCTEFFINQKLRGDRTYD